MSRASQLTHEQLLPRIGAVCLIVGSVVVMIFRISHGDLPTDSGAAALSFVAARPLYPLVHLGDVLGFVVWASGLVALSDTLAHRVAWAVGRLGAVSVLVGVAVHFIEFSIDGFALPTLANTWAVAAPAERLNLEQGARLVLVAIGGPAVIGLAVLWGTTLALYGLAVKQEGYSRWLGWTGLVLGVVLFLLGVIFYLKPNSFPGHIGGASLDLGSGHRYVASRRCCRRRRILGCAVRFCEAAPKRMWENRSAPSAHASVFKL
jgi:hypothetical protein